MAPRLLGFIDGDISSKSFDRSDMSPTVLLPIVAQFSNYLQRPENKELARVVPSLVEPLVLAVLEHPHKEEGAQSARPSEDHPAVKILPPRRNVLGSDRSSRNANVR